MQEKLLLVRVLLCSILSSHMHYALSAIIHKNFLFFIVSLSHHHLSPIASSLPGYWRMFWSLKHSPQLLLWPLTHGIWLYSQLCWWVFLVLGALLCYPWGPWSCNAEPDQGWCRKRARPNIFSGGPDLDHDASSSVIMDLFLCGAGLFVWFCCLVWFYSPQPGKWCAIGTVNAGLKKTNQQPKKPKPVKALKSVVGGNDAQLLHLILRTMSDRGVSPAL